MGVRFRVKGAHALLLDFGVDGVRGSGSGGSRLSGSAPGSAGFGV